MLDALSVTSLAESGAVSVGPLNANEYVSRIRVLSKPALYPSVFGHSHSYTRQDKGKEFVQQVKVYRNPQHNQKGIENPLMRGEKREN